MAKLLLPALAVGVALVLTNDATRTVRQAADQFHLQFRESRFEEIYGHGSPALQRGTREEDFVAGMLEVRRRLGEVRVEKDAPPSEPTLTLDDRKLVAEVYKLGGTEDECWELIFWEVRDAQVSLDAYSVQCHSGLQIDFR